ncbi:hypothetical protein ACWEP4_13260 [Streptomyces sp. NPDC004227]
MGGLRQVTASFVVPGPSGVAIRSSLKGLTGQDETVLRLVGSLLGSLASRDLRARCAAGLDHDGEQWARRKRALTGDSSSRWAGSITKSTHDQLDGTAQHRDAQLRHALIRLLHWTSRHGLALAIEDLDFAAEKTREKYGRRKRFRKLISGMPTARLRARLVSMAAELGVTVVAVDPAYTSRWGAQHWQRPLTSKNRKPTRHEAAAGAIGRRALGCPIRRRTAPPSPHRSDAVGHRTVQAVSGSPGREGPRPRIPGPRTRSVGAGRGAKAGDQCVHNRSGHTAEHESWQQDSLPLSLEER